MPSGREDSQIWNCCARSWIRYSTYLLANQPTYQQGTYLVPVPYLPTDRTTTLVYLPYLTTYCYPPTYILPVYIQYLPTYLPTYRYLPAYLLYVPTDLLTVHTYLPTYLHTYLHLCTAYLPTSLPTYLPTYLSSLGRYVFGSEISYNKPPPRLPGLGC